MGQRNLLLEQIRRIALRAGGDRPTDGQLLERFIAVRDEIAFEALLRRHGPMVLGVCRRILGNPHDADDAFQAVFLVLVRKATTIRPRDAVGNWLYGVAFRTALEARGRIARRRMREKQLDILPHPAVEWPDRGSDLRPLLDRELHRLADKYRLPIVLCDLEGRSRKEVARQLGIPEGTLSSRLATGRQQLARRLLRYGFVLSATSFSALVAAEASAAWVPFGLFSTTVKAALVMAAGPTAAAGIGPTAAASLMEGVLKAMLVAKIKTATVVLCSAAALGLGTGGIMYQTRAGASDSQIVGGQQGQQPAGPLPRELQKARSEVDKLRAEAEAQRRRAEMARQQAEEAARAAKRAEEQLRRAESAARRAAPEVQIGRGQGANGLPRVRSAMVQIDKANQQGEPPDLKRSMAELQREMSRMLREIERQRTQLEDQIKRLEAQKKRMMAEFGKKRAELQRAVGAKQIELQKQLKQRLEQNRIATGQKLPPPAGDKLDRILERLERLEKRLDRLERNKE